MKKTYVFLLGLCLLFSTVVMAREESPLKWKAQRWQFVVIIQTGDWLVHSDTGSKYVEMKVVRILRGNKQDMPEIEWWRGKELEPQHAYLFCYHKSPPGSSDWGYSAMEETKEGSIVKSIDPGEHPEQRQGADDVGLADLEKLLKDIPFESNPTNTFYYQHGMAR
jgi:hypothetical protein